MEWVTGNSLPASGGFQPREWHCFLGSGIEGLSKDEASVGEDLGPWELAEASPSSRDSGVEGPGIVLARTPWEKA
jgi:hypothetical protein